MAGKKRAKDNQVYSTVMNKPEHTPKTDESRYRAVFENIQDVYYETSLDGVILELSPSIATTSKFSREGLISD
jgi:PAS domain-containing protein